MPANIIKRKEKGADSGSFLIAVCKITHQLLLRRHLNQIKPGTNCSFTGDRGNRSMLADTVGNQQSTDSREPGHNPPTSPAVTHKAELEGA